jgi:glycosyltransferase 2 family protein
MSLPARKKYLTPLNLIYFLLGMGLLVFLLRKVDFPSLSELILKIKPQFLLLAGLIYLVKACLRSARFTHMNESSNAGFGSMMRLSLASSLATQLMPLKLGELSYVYLLKRDNRATITQGLSSLVIIRIFDLLAIALLFLAFALGFGTTRNMSVYFYSILGFVGFLLVVILALLVLSRYGEPLLAFVFRIPLLQKIPYSGKLRLGLEGIFQTLNQYRPQAFLIWIVLAALEWSVNYAVYHVLLVGMGWSPAFFDSVVGVTFAALASVLPVNSFGSFGTQEAGWASGLVLIGYSQTQAINSAFATHLLSLLFMLIFGGVAWLSYLFIRSRRVPKPQQVS